MPVSGRSVAFTAAGFVLLYSGYANRSIKDTLTGFLKGQPPAPAPTGPPSIGIGGTGAAAAGPANANAPTPSAIANDALRYVGHPYLYGGAPGPDGANGWDCSSFANWVLGHDFGMQLPGESSAGYAGTSHGPTTLGYLAWSACTTISNKGSDAQAGDLLVWQTHMGFSLGGGQMVSALGAKWGTVQTTIPGGSPTGEILFVRRLKTSTTSTAPASGGIFPTPSGKAPAGTLPGAA
jgi:cell wall-associated NlpC family hydrolase